MKFIPALLTVLLLTCQPSPTPEPAALTQLAVAKSDLVNAELLARGPLRVGQNQVFYRLTKELPGARLEQLPARAQQSAPVQNPTAPNAEGLWEGLIIFTEPGQWSLAVDVENSGARDRLDFGALEIADSAQKLVVTREGKELVLTFGFSETPHVGANELVITAHQASDAMSFVTVDDLNFTVTSQMPSMGHGAAGTLNPVRGADGLYRGTVVLSMAGDWTIHVVIAANDAQLGTFELTAQL